MTNTKTNSKQASAKFQQQPTAQKASKKFPAPAASDFELEAYETLFREVRKQRDTANECAARTARHVRKLEEDLRDYKRDLQQFRKEGKQLDKRLAAIRKNAPALSAIVIAAL